MTRYIQRRRPRLDVYTDGACSGPQGPGGWAWAVATDPPGFGDAGSGGSPRTTNQRMEMQAVIEALQEIQGLPLTIVTDSAYVMNCFTEEWYRGWKDGRKRNGDPVANWDLWQTLIFWVDRSDVAWRKVKGHSGDPMNDYVDRLAVAAKRAQKAVLL